MTDPTKAFGAQPSIIQKLIPNFFKLPEISFDTDGSELLGFTSSDNNTANSSEKPLLDKEGLKVEVRQFSIADTDEIHDFLVNSKDNHGPFRAAISELINNKNKISHYLSDWNLRDPEEYAKYDNLHALFFGSYVNSKLVATTICAVKCNEGIIEIGGLVAPGLKGKGIGQMTGMKIMNELRKYPYYKGTIKKFVFETQLDNIAAQTLAAKVGVKLVSRTQDGIVFEFDF